MCENKSAKQEFDQLSKNIFDIYVNCYPKASSTRIADSKLSTVLASLYMGYSLRVLVGNPIECNYVHD